MRTAEHMRPWLIAAALLTLSGGSVPVAAQEETPAVDTAISSAAVADTAPSGLTFNEIQLADGAVRATDTAGGEWRYDFERHAWVADRAGAEGSFADRRITRDLPPIERRATQRREVEPGESSVTIGYDEYVDGDILVAGRVTVNGWVKGTVRSISKRVLVTETGQVDGDVEAPSVVVRTGGVVMGEIRETGSPLDPRQFSEVISVDAIVAVTAVGGVMLFIGFLLVAVIPANITRIGDCIAGYRVRCYTLGLLLIFLLPVITALFIITIVGILLTPLLPVAYVSAMVLGFVAVSGVIGRRVLAIAPGRAVSAQAATLVGTALLVILWLVVITLLGQDNAVLTGLGIALLVIAILVTSYPICTGIGASFLTRFGRREYVSWREHRPPDAAPPTPAPPPLHTPSIEISISVPPPPRPPERPYPGPPTQQS